jgi:alginate O-acetyltransferase complex protein AlgI
MLFNSFIFFFFLGVVLPIFYTLKEKCYKNGFLLFCSYVFYGYWDWRFCFLLATSTIVDYFVGIKIHTSKSPKTRKFFLLLSVFVNLGILGFFKYFNFFIDSFNQLATTLGYSLDFLHLNIILPVGISFYTFQTLSYSIDIHRGRLTPTRNFIDFALFVAFFPQLVAGPIERARNLLPQIASNYKPNRHQIYSGIVLIVTGLFRKVIIGDSAGRIVDHVFSDLSLYKSVEVICALALFSIQIYADFSGYSKIARGTAKLLGIELMKNFNQPYFSRNITEFWRRWHISLSSWFRDYLYISLGGNQKGKWKTYRNLFITMLLGGLWHGASWNFVIWGGLHGAYLAVHKLYLKNQKPTSSKILSLTPSILMSIVATNFLVVFTWLFFRATSLESTKMFFSKIWYWESSEYALHFITIVAAYYVLTLILDFLEYYHDSHVYILKIKSIGVRTGILATMFLITLMYLFQAGQAPFIYFQF